MEPPEAILAADCLRRFLPFSGGRPEPTRSSARLAAVHQQGQEPRTPRMVSYPSMARGTTGPLIKMWGYNTKRLLTPGITRRIADYHRSIDDNQYPLRS